MDTGKPLEKFMLSKHAIHLPDSRGIRATNHILKIVKALTKEDLLIVLLSGGTSSLLCAPTPGLTLTDKQRTTNILLDCGATIHEINAVRKHLSAVKGGRLAQTTSATILTVAISDVLGDNIDIIGSGPTVPDPSTFEEAKAVLEHYRVWNRVPENIRNHLNRGIHNQIPETWKSRKRQPAHSHSIILANNRTAIDGMAPRSYALGLQTTYPRSTLPR